MEFHCSDCPRNCNALRNDSHGFGYCQAPALPQIIRAAAHPGEEPCISGRNGAGTIFLPAAAFAVFSARILKSAANRPAGYLLHPLSGI